MHVFLIVAAFVGIILGLRFNVFVLVPVILLAIALITLSEIAAHQSAGVILFATFAALVLLVGHRRSRNRQNQDIEQQTD